MRGHYHLRKILTLFQFRTEIWRLTKLRDLSTLVQLLQRSAMGADMAKTVADQFAEVLVTAGVKRIYGIVGDS